MSDSRRIQVIKSFRRTQNAFTIARTDRRINAQTKKQTFVMEQYREQKQSEQLQTLHFLNVFFWIWRLHFVQVIQGFFAPTFWHDFFLKLHCFYIVLMFFWGFRPLYIDKINFEMFSIRDCLVPNLVPCPIASPDMPARWWFIPDLRCWCFASRNNTLWLKLSTSGIVKVTVYDSIFLILFQVWCPAPA